MAPLSPGFSPTIEFLRAAATETARRLGKRVRLEIGGDSPEEFSGIFHGLRDALLHAIRNSIDHGIERPSERRESGKPEIGRIRIEVSARSEELVVTIQDDGAGIDLDSVLRRAIELGLPSADRAKARTEILELLFVPGFSTLDRAGSVSGRGIGLDAVRALAETSGGSAEIDTTRGEGTTLVLRVRRENREAAA